MSSYDSEMNANASPSRQPRRRAPNERTLAIYRRHVIFGERQADIARDLGCSRRRVVTICRGVARWINSARPTIDVPALKLAHHVMLTGLAGEALAEWEKSKQPDRVTKARLVQGRTDKSGAPQAVVTSEQTDREQCGNPRYLQLCNDLLKSIRGIWGADASKPSAGVGEGHVAMSAVLDQLSERLASHPESVDQPPSNVFNVAAALEQIAGSPNEGGETDRPITASRRKNGADRDRQ